jgi:hypothetical protein
MNDIPPPPMQVSLTEWRPLRRNSLLGFASIRVGALLIKDVTVHASNGKRWAGLPAKPRIASGGEVMKDDKGKILYTPVMEWTNRETADRFSNAVIAAVSREHPHDVDA